jgi:hypothetical protein
VDAEYLVGASNGDLTAERVVTDTATIAWDLATPGQAKASVTPTWPIAVTAAGGSITSGTVSFANSNGVSFGINGQTITASAAGGAAGSNTLGMSNLGNTSGTTGVISGSALQMVFAGGNNITLSQSINGSSATITISAFTALTSQSNQALSAGNGSFTFQTATFADSNGISFSTGTQGIYASYTVPTQTVESQSLGMSNVGNTSGTTGMASGGQVRFVFAGGNNVTLSQSLNGASGTITISAFNQTGSQYSAGMSTGGNTVGDTGLASQRLVLAGGNNITLSGSTNGGSMTITISGGAGGAGNTGSISAGTTRGTLGEVVFSNSNGFSFGMDGQTVTASYTVPTVTNSSMTVSDAGTSGTLALLAFTNLNGVTLSLSTGAGGSHTIVGSHNALTSQSNQAFSAAGGSSAFQTLGFSDNARASFTNTNGSVGIASVRASMFAASNTTQSSSGTQNLDAITFAGAGIASVGVTNGSVVISVPAGGGAGDGGVFAGVSTGGNTLGSTGTVSTGNFVLVGSRGITLSQSTGAAGSAATVTMLGYPNLSGWSPYGTAPMALMGDQNQSLELYPHIVSMPAQWDRVVIPIYYSQATNSTLTVSRTLYWGLYSKNAGSLSLVSSNSLSYSINGSGTASSASNSGIRIVSVGETTTLQPGNYWIGFVGRSSTSGANATISRVAMSQLNSSISGYIGSASVTNLPLFPGAGVWTSTTSGIPNSLAFTDIRANSSAFQRPQIIIFTSGTT